MKMSERMEQSGQPSTAAAVIDFSMSALQPGYAPRDISVTAHPSVLHADQELARLRQALAHAREQIAELCRLAGQDCLTGLANRRCIMAEIDRAIERHRLHGQPAALVLFDMDRLKQLNDRHGHQTGDAAIVHVAHIIRDAVPDGIAARLGGDEFVLLLPDSAEAEAHGLAAQVAARIARAPLWCQTGRHALSVSAGVACVGAGVTARGLLASADAAMYANKREKPPFAGRQS